MRSFLICLILLLPLPLSGQQDVKKESPAITESIEESADRRFRELEEDGENPDFTNQLVNLTFAIVLVIILMVILTWVLKRFMQGKIQQMNVSSPIKLLETRSISTKTALHLIEVENRTILIGESAGGIEKLTEFLSDRSAFSEMVEK